MKEVFYNIIKYFFYFAARLYFRRVKVYGLNNIPKDGGVLFSPNHQGALLDPLLVGSNISRSVTSLTRSDVFGGPFQWFMDALRMLPVYRIRNGYANLKKNDKIFEKCREILGNGECIMMFSEAAHHNEYFLQRLSKGSSRLALEAQMESPESLIYIVPVGINYGHHQIAWSDLHLVYGKPINLKNFLNDNNSDAENINLLRENLEEKMRKCIWLPDKNDQYFEKKKMIIPKNTKLEFNELKEGIEKGSLKTEGFGQKVFSNNPRLLEILILLFSIPNFLPLLVIKNVISKFKDIVFYSSVKICLGPIIFMLWWLIVPIITYNLSGENLEFGAFIEFCSLVEAPLIISLYVRQILLFCRK